MVYRMTVAAECAFEDVVDEVAEAVWTVLVARTGRLYSGYRVAVRGVVRAHLVAARGADDWRMRDGRWSVSLRLAEDARAFAGEMARGVVARLEEVLRGRAGADEVAGAVSAAVVRSLDQTGDAACCRTCRDRHRVETMGIAA